MRLTAFEQQTIKELSQQYFGKDAHIWLFGSRVDDHERGGDIDLYLETPEQDRKKLMKAKGDFLWELQENIGFQKIDFVLHQQGAKTLPIYEVARQEGILLI